MTFGLLISSVCRTETAAVQSAISVYYPTLLLSGKWMTETLNAGTYRAICCLFILSLISFIRSLVASPGHASMAALH